MRNPSRITVLGWAALIVSLVATVLVVAAITPFARGALPALPEFGTGAIYGFALIWFWLFVILGIVIDVVAGVRGGSNRWIAMAGGILMALAGCYALGTFAIIASQVRRAAGA